MQLIYRLLLLLGLSLAIAPAYAARQALVIGNAAYTDGPLKNPVNDARAMDQKLSSLGFKVQRIENMKRQHIGRTLTAFASAIRPGDEVVVFYAGHGVQVKGINYLPAVDADIQSEEDVALNSLNLNSLMERLDEAKAGLKLLFLDACRNNPYARSFRSGDRGLARVGAAPSGTLIHFATRPGSVAADGSGANGLYTSQLVRLIDTPNMPVEIMLKKVAAAVEAASKGAQDPWTEGSIRGDFYFNAGPSGQVASVAAERLTNGAKPVAPRVEVVDAADQSQQRLEKLREAARQLDEAETTLWKEAQASGGIQAVLAFLEKYPDGRYSSMARERLVALRKADAELAAQSTTNHLVALFNQAKAGNASKFSEIREAAKQGNAEAQNFAGACYVYGYGVEKDMTEATRWYIRSARQGNQHATNNLEVLRKAGFMVDVLERSTQ